MEQVILVDINGTFDNPATVYISIYLLLEKTRRKKDTMMKFRKRKRPSWMMCVPVLFCLAFQVGDCFAKAEHPSAPLKIGRNVRGTWIPQFMAWFRMNMYILFQSMRMHETFGFAQHFQTTLSLDKRTHPGPHLSSLSCRLLCTLG